MLQHRWLGHMSVHTVSLLDPQLFKDINEDSLVCHVNLVKILELQLFHLVLGVNNHSILFILVYGPCQTTSVLPTFQIVRHAYI